MPSKMNADRPGDAIEPSRRNRDVAASDEVRPKARFHSSKDLSRLPHRRFHPEIRVGDLMLTESHAPTIAAEVEQALTALLQHNPTAVWEFEQTFHDRSHLPGFIESGRGSRGIEGALEELLSTRFRVGSQSSNLSGNLPNDEFVTNLRLAVQKLAHERPLPLLVLKKNQLRASCSLEDALIALFADYHRRARAYPY